jgi:ribose transport system permease protein
VAIGVDVRADGAHPHSEAVTTDTSLVGPVLSAASATSPAEPPAAAQASAAQLGGIQLGGGTRPGPGPRRLLGLARRDFGVDRFSGLYVIILMIIAFSLWEPSTFGTRENAIVILSSQAITGMVALGAMIGLIAGVFDLSIAANMSLAISVVGTLQASAHLNAALAVLLTLAIGGLVGCVNAIIVTRFRIDAVIATLAMSSILAAVAYWVAGGQDILYGISPTFDRFGSAKPLGIPVTVYYLAAVALILWYLLEHTPVGRYLYAAGANPQAARLSGVRVVRLQRGALIVSGVLSAMAGVVLSMQLGASSFGAGDSYLLPAFACAFLGATQIRPGRFNVAGTLVSIYLLAIGVKGLQLRYPQFAWIADLVEGIVLLIAVGAAVQSARRRRMQR